MKSKLFLLLLFFIVGCGNLDEKEINIHFISKTEMIANFGENVLGHAIWSDKDYILFELCDSKRQSSTTLWLLKVFYIDK